MALHDPDVLRRHPQRRREEGADRPVGLAALRRRGDAEADAVAVEAGRLRAGRARHDLQADDDADAGGRRTDRSDRGGHGSTATRRSRPVRLVAASPSGLSGASSGGFSGGGSGSLGGCDLQLRLAGVAHAAVTSPRERPCPRRGRVPRILERRLRASRAAVQQRVQLALAFHERLAPVLVVPERLFPDERGIVRVVDRG